MFNKMRWLLANLFCVFLTTFALSQSPWLGKYEFTENGGKNAGGTVMMVTHHLEILKSEDGLVATLESNGYQTSKDLLCLVKVQGNKAMLYFEGYGDNNVFESYTKGQLMLTLEQKNEVGKKTLLTYWNEFKPIVPKNEKNGKVYFARL